MPLQIRQLRVYLVANDIKVVLSYDVRDLFQIFFLHNGAGRIIRERHHQKLGLRCDGSLQRFRRQTEFILRLQLNDHRNASCKHGARHVGHVARLRD